MLTFVSLLRFTDQGAAAIHQSTQRARAFRQAAEQAGVHVVGQYWLMGEFDGLLVLQAETASAARRCLAELVAAGFVRTHTSPAYTADEMQVTP